MTKLYKRDTTSSYDEFQRYAQPYKLIPTTSSTHPVDNENPKFIYQRSDAVQFYSRRKTDNYETDMH